MLERGYGAFKAYAQSKLANILFTRELARRLEGTGVTANALHPGFVGSNLGHQPGALGRLGNLFATTFGKSPAQGAATSLYLARAPEVSDVTGGYFIDARPHSPKVPEASVAARLWDVSEQLLAQPG